MGFIVLSEERVNMPTGIYKQSRYLDFPLAFGPTGTVRGLNGRTQHPADSGSF